ncbi:MAG: zinc ribbon domain-containing protein [Phycisphaerales bacterium]|nr:zinc ribbon domain-containing protein [Phycisphaerales bacterium]
MSEHRGHRIRIVVGVTAAFLLLGAVTTVAIGWGAVTFGGLGAINSQWDLFAGPEPGERPEGAPPPLAWPLRVPEGWPRVQGVSWSDGFGVRWDGGVGGTDTQTVITSVRAGWPMGALRWVDERVIDGTGAASSMSLRGSVRNPIATGSMGSWGWYAGSVPRDLPISPIWLGLAADVLVLAAGWAVLLLGGRAGVRVAVRARRRRRGHCEACGYEVGQGVTTCPECGAARETLEASSSPSA